MRRRQQVHDSSKALSLLGPNEVARLMLLFIAHTKIPGQNAKVQESVFFALPILTSNSDWQSPVKIVCRIAMELVEIAEKPLEGNSLAHSTRYVAAHALNMLAFFNGPAVRPFYVRLAGLITIYDEAIEKSLANDFDMQLHLREVRAELASAVQLARKPAEHQSEIEKIREFAKKRSDPYMDYEKKLEIDQGVYSFSSASFCQVAFAVLYFLCITLAFQKNNQLFLTFFLAKKPHKEGAIVTLYARRPHKGDVETQMFDVFREVVSDSVRNEYARQQNTIPGFDAMVDAKLHIASLLRGYAGAYRIMLNDGIIPTSGNQLADEIYDFFGGNKRVVNDKHGVIKKK